MEGEFDYINNTYGLKVKKGTRILCTYDNTRGTVVGADGGILKVAQDNGEVGKYSYYHPTWHMVYETTDKLDRIEQGRAE